MNTRHVLAVGFALVAVASAQQCGQRNSRSLLMSALKLSDSNYIVGGTEARKNEFPWQVLIQVNGPTTQHMCGGSIINDRWIVTAAHCIKEGAKESDFVIVAGAHDIMKMEDTTQVRGAGRIIVHPGYDKHHAMNDIALIKLNRPLTISPRSVAPICLPKSGDARAFHGKICTASGWGRFSIGGPASPVLLKVNLPIVSNNVCEDRYSNVRRVKINDDVVCAGNIISGGVGTCQGDSGGPLACEKDGAYTLVGLTSYGVVCGSRQHPNVFTRVSSFRGWIDSNID